MNSLISLLKSKKNQIGIAFIVTLVVGLLLNTVIGLVAGGVSCLVTSKLKNEAYFGLIGVGLATAILLL